MINLEKFLQKEFDDDFINDVRIGLSPIDEFDYQASVYKIMAQGKQQELEDFLKVNTKINDVFTYEFSTSDKSHNNAQSDPSKKQQFLCFKIKKSYLDNLVKSIYNTPGHQTIKFVEPVGKPKKVLFDYSSPNLAKDMHVGHLRSTILGDVLANISEYFGNIVTRTNHLGDFGLPFGMIIEYVIANGIIIDPSTSLQQLYILAKNSFDSNEQFKSNAYVRTSELQMESDEQVVKVWKQIYEHSLNSYQQIYDLLRISPNLTIKGESYYVRHIDEVKKLLEENNLIKLDDKGRTIVLVDRMNPMIYEKSGERGSAYTYDTTDIATLWYRTVVLDQDEVYYVVDSGQALHFKQLIQLGKQMNWSINKDIQHIAFGVITGTNGRRIASRLGNTPKLVDLVNAGINETTDTFTEKGDANNKPITDDITQTISDVTIGSIKYFDLSKCRTSSYEFDFRQMLRHDGNTYTYLSYSLARARGVLDKFNDAGCIMPEELDYDKLEEVDYKIIRQIATLPVILEKVLETNMPHHLCDYINKLSSLLHNNYAQVRCINFETIDEVVDGVVKKVVNYNKAINFNESRIMVFILVKYVLEACCGLLGLPIVDKL